ncbi:RarD protein [Escherichia coli]|uniref:RarD protein n=1 Tax=Escherichia coli TaxID=562 RepID=A0A2X3JUT1_ECOLX|nr:RarD protein [Escherichia coli]
MPTAQQPYGAKPDVAEFTADRRRIVTTVPLLCFTAAATRLRLSTLGFFQYIGPTLMFLLAVTFYGEKPGADKMVTFAFIWVALAIFVMDAIYTQRRKS